MRWSYGSIKGRPDSAWQVTLRDQVGPIGALPALLGLGFQGIWIDTYGYSYGGLGDGGEIDDIVAAVGEEPLVSPDGRFVFLDLRGFRERVDMTDEELAAISKEILGVQPPEVTP